MPDRKTSANRRRKPHQRPRTGVVDFGTERRLIYTTADELQTIASQIRDENLAVHYALEEHSRRMMDVCRRIDEATARTGVKHG